DFCRHSLTCFVRSSIVPPCDREFAIRRFRSEHCPVARTCGPLLKVSLADGVGFEPTKDLRPCRISSPVHSTALPPIRTIGRRLRNAPSVRTTNLYPDGRLPTS